MSSLAMQDGDGYRLTGRKVFISGAADADRMLVVARTQKAGEVERRTEGMSLFVVDTDAPGVELQPLNIDVGWPERQYLVFFDEVQLDADRLIGQPGQGLAGMFEALNSERLLVTAMSVGLGNYALKKAVTYANERKPFGVPIGSYQALQHRLAEAKAELEAARLVMIQAAADLRCGRQCRRPCQHGQVAGFARRGQGRRGRAANPRRLRFRPGLRHHHAMAVGATDGDRAHQQRNAAQLHRRTCPRPAQILLRRPRDRARRIHGPGRPGYRPVALAAYARSSHTALGACDGLPWPIVQVAA